MSSTEDEVAISPCIQSSEMCSPSYGAHKSIYLLIFPLTGRGISILSERQSNSFEEEATDELIWITLVAFLNECLYRQSPSVGFKLFPHNQATVVRKFFDSCLLHF